MLDLEDHFLVHHSFPLNCLTLFHFHFPFLQPPFFLPLHFLFLHSLLPFVLLPSPPLHPLLHPILLFLLLHPLPILPFLPLLSLLLLLPLPLHPLLPIYPFLLLHPLLPLVDPNLHLPLFHSLNLEMLSLILL